MSDFRGRPEFSLSVVAPFFNEEANIVSFIRRTRETLLNMGVDFELILVDDGSTDLSLEKAREFLSTVPEQEWKILQSPHNSGIFSSWIRGLRQCSKQLAVLIDSDLQNPPEAISSLYTAFLGSVCHFVQGTRSSLEFGGGSRLFFSRSLNVVLNFVFKGSAKDHKSGFVLGPRKLLLAALEPGEELRFGQTFVRALLEGEGHLIHEVETLFLPRAAGQSFLAGKQFSTAVRVLMEFPAAVALNRRRRRKARSTLYPITKSGLGLDSRAQQPKLLREKVWKFLFFFTLPIHTWNISQRSRGYLSVLEASDYFDGKLIEELQQVRLRRLLWHCFGTVPFYRKFFIDNCLLPDDDDISRVLSRMPLLSKEDVTSALYFDLFSHPVKTSKLQKISTSGSTGKPFTTYADSNQLDVRFATTLRAQQAAGWRFGRKQMRLWHQNIGLSRFREFQERLNALVSRRIFVPAFEMNEAALSNLVEKIERHKPVLIDGYAESFNYIAKALRQRTLSHAPKAVMASAQILTSQTRKEIEERLRTHVYDKYGSREFSGIAYECSSPGNHHVQWESYLVEVLVKSRPAEPGEIGEVVITDLNNFSVPLIRYRVGDLAEAKLDAPCSCGRASRRLGEIVGRTQALVLVSNGVWLPGTFFAHFFKDYETLVSQFQILQNDESGFVLNCVKGPNWSEDAWDSMMNALRVHTGHETRIDVAYVEIIKLGRTGKRAPVVSSIRNDFQKISL